MSIGWIGVRHEEVDAFAASGESQVTDELADVMTARQELAMLPTIGAEQVKASASACCERR